MDELTLLQAVRLKGRVRPADRAATLDEDEAAVEATVKELAGAGLLGTLAGSPDPSSIRTTQCGLHCTRN